MANGIKHTRVLTSSNRFSIGVMVLVMLPLVLLPLLSIFIFGTSSGIGTFWKALKAPEAVFALKLSIVTSFWATVFNVFFGLFAAYVLSKYNFWGRNAVIVTISLPTAIPTAVAGFALLLLWGPYGLLGRFARRRKYAAAYVHSIRDHPCEYICHFSAGVRRDQTCVRTMSASLEEASATMGATRWQTFWHVTLPSLRGALLGGALLTFARAVGRVRVDDPRIR
jgi:sulfate transport system permease protein